VTVDGDPADVYACSCAACQKRSGGAFAYAALYPEGSVTVVGDYKTWAQSGDSGRLIETSFCPNCGVTVFFHAQGLPGLIGVPVGCFADPGFAKPARLYWASRKHAWLDLGGDIPKVETQ
jgi:hypothetical protein